MMKNLSSVLPQINCDLGEGIPNEEMVFPWIDVASIACGGHYGTEESIEKSLSLAKIFKKQVGAHPSYPDLENFGRKSISISQVDLAENLSSQIHLFLSVSTRLNLDMDHIKFHGALYNDAAKDAGLADFLTDFLSEEFPTIPVFVPPHSFMQEFAKKKNLPHRLEIFGDRAYLDNYQLAPRTMAGSLFTDVEVVEKHLKTIFLNAQIKTIQGNLIEVQADTLCFHGDNPGILDFLPKIRQTYSW
jgi:5-oxoprolinase (ATP-hydrolysing) subunit A